MTHRKIVIVIVATAGTGAFAAKIWILFAQYLFGEMASLKNSFYLENQQSQPEPDMCVIASLGSRLVGLDSGAWLICKN